MTALIVLIAIIGTIIFLQVDKGDEQRSVLATVIMRCFYYPLGALWIIGIWGSVWN